jgi:outer membrane autotransporter protein
VGQRRQRGTHGPRWGRRDLRPRCPVRQLAPRRRRRLHERGRQRADAREFCQRRLVPPRRLRGARHGAWGVRAGAAVAWHEIDTSRSVIFPGFADQLRASYDGTTAQAFGEVGYVFTAGRVAFEAFAGLAWVSVGAGGFVETGGAAALTGFDGSHDVGYSTIGLRTATSMPLSNGMVLIPRASAAWQHAFDDTVPRASLAFLGTGTGFTIAGVPIARDSALVDAGFGLAVTANATLGLSYVGQLADGAQDHSVRGKAVWRF